jgi:hypothetical protein
MWRPPVKPTAPLCSLSALLAMVLAQGAHSESTPKRSSRASVALVDYGLNNNILFSREDPNRPGEWGNLPRISLEISNREDRPLWVALHLSGPFLDRVCDQRIALGPGERAKTLCTQDSVDAGVDYHLDLTAFADSGYAQVLDASSWTFQVRKSEVSEWESNRRLQAATAAVSMDASPTSPPRSEAPAKPVNHAALHLAIRNTGVSIGNAPVVHGLRFNWNDQALQHVDGVNITVLSSASPEGVVHGIEFCLGPSDANSLEPYLKEVWGIGLSVSSLAVVRSRGIMIGGVYMGGVDVAGVHVGGLIMSGQPAAGIQIGSLVWGGPMSGVNVAALGAWSETGPMTGINLGGLVVRGIRLSGLNVAGLAVSGDERLRGLSVGGLFVGGERVAGINAAPIFRTDDLTGLAAAGWNQVGVQRGITIGVFNRAEELHGVQIGLLNVAENNAGARTKLPILNFHFGQ